jgi:hypothetical protein
MLKLNAVTRIFHELDNRCFVGMSVLENILDAGIASIFLPLLSDILLVFRDFYIISCDYRQIHFPDLP